MAIVAIVTDGDESVLLRSWAIDAETAAELEIVARARLGDPDEDLEFPNGVADQLGTLMGMIGWDN